MSSKNQLLVFLDGLFLWLPNDRTPGVLAFGVLFLRQAVLPLLTLLSAFGILQFFMSILTGEKPYDLKTHLDPTITVTLLFGSYSIFQELARYGFVRRAVNKAMALGLFTAVISISTMFFFYKNLGACFVLIVLHVVASVLCYNAVKLKYYAPFSIFVSAVVFTVVYVVRPYPHL